MQRLQSALHLPVDGEFGPETEAAIRAAAGPSRADRGRRRRPGDVERDRRARRGDAHPTPLRARAAAARAGCSWRPPRRRAPVERWPGGGRCGGGEERLAAAKASVARVIAAGDEIATRPYVYGGGHGSFQSTGYDCSGSVSYALHGAGLLSSPEDSTGLESYGEPGPGQATSRSTRTPNTRSWWWTANASTRSPWQETGSRWSNRMTSTAGFVVRHPAGFVGPHPAGAAGPVDTVSVQSATRACSRRGQRGGMRPSSVAG